MNLITFRKQLVSAAKARIKAQKQADKRLGILEVNILDMHKQNKQQRIKLARAFVHSN